LTEFRPVLPDLFDVGGEVLAYHDFDELLDQVTRLLNEPGLTERLGDAARSAPISTIPYEKRLITILEKIS